MFKIQKLANINLSFLLPVLLLCIIGAATVYSTTFTDPELSSLFTNQIVFYFLGLTIFLFITVINPKLFKKKVVNFLIAILTTLALIGVLLFGTEIYGAQRWINLGFFSLQPSEFAKIAIIIITSYCLAVRSKKDTQEIFNIYRQADSSFQEAKRFLTSETFIKFALSIIFYALTIVLVIKQKSLGNSILISLIFITVLVLNININFQFGFTIILFVTGVLIGFNIPDFTNINQLIAPNVEINIVPVIFVLIVLFFLIKNFKFNLYLLYLFFFLGMLISPLAHYFYNNVLESYQKQRIETFLGTNNSEELYQNEDFNRQMSILAVGSGRVFGKGFLNGNIVNSRLLPFAYTDFAFAGFSEQFGFAGSMLIIALYFLLFIHIFRVYYRTKNTFYKLLCIGTIALIFFNSAQHIAMNLGLTPITGVPLPLISYGGSSILATFIALGIINSIDTVKDSEVQINKLDSNYGFGIES